MSERHLAAQKKSADKVAVRKKKASTTKERQRKKNHAKSLVIKNNYVRAEYKKGMGSDFYATREWRELRWQVLSTSTGQCIDCGRSRHHHDVVMHIDHVKPRSRYPELELEITNLQVLCEDCNIGKGPSI